MPVYSEPAPKNFDLADLDLRNIELSLSKSPPVDIIAESEAAARQSKLEQLHAHLEAAKKLEQELSFA